MSDLVPDNLPEQPHQPDENGVKCPVCGYMVGGTACPRCGNDMVLSALRDACNWILESFPHPTDRPESLREWCAVAGIKLEPGDILIPREFRGSLRCLTCGELLSEGDDLVEHMMGHNPGARKLSMEALRENTEWVPEDREKCPRCGIPVPKMPENVTYPEALCDECAKDEGFM